MTIETANTVAERVRRVFNNDLTDFLTDPGGYLAYYSNEFGSVDDETAAAAIDLLRKRCALHSAYEANYCPVCGTARKIGG